MIRFLNYRYRLFNKIARKANAVFVPDPSIPRNLKWVNAYIFEVDLEYLEDYDNCNDDYLRSLKLLKITINMLSENLLRLFRLYYGDMKTFM